ncbi:MAG: carboxypeptidase regulatory-like domain-containing protein [Gammaproteobacteria bacterium]|nr:carboxypeptidase regulatory-like domain-containing protein [Gammaproteobacteria bacterium]
MRLALLLLPLLAACAGAGQAPARLEGRVELAPVCGNLAVEGRPCEPKPLAVELRVLAADGGRPVTSLRSTADGRFRLELPAGDYLLAVEYPGPFRHPPRAVHLEPGDNPFLPIVLDSGIR